jgi:lipopolysaccharide biosynthesis glycosyltransferase
MYVDSDITFVKSIDHLFDLKAPAAKFVNPVGSGNQSLYGPLKHGDTVKWNVINKSLHSKCNVIFGGLFLVEPSKRKYDEMLKILSKGPYRHKAISYGDEVMIVDIHRQDWTNIDPMYNCAAGTDDKHLDRVAGWHYISNKPLKMARDKWPDLKYWWSVTDKVIAKYPQTAHLFKIVEKVKPHTASHGDATKK